MTKHIYLCTDNRGHLPHCAAVMASTLENTPGELAFHIVHTGLSEDDRRSLQGVAADCPVTFHAIDEAQVLPWAGRARLRRLTLGTYYRLVIPLIAPAEASRALYLDYDTIVDGDLSPLWECDMGGKPIGMARELVNPDWPDKCNAGVLLFNLEALRRLPYAQRLSEYAATHELPFHDESILNGVFRGDTVFLPAEYNVITPYLKRRNIVKYGLRARIARPVVIHYLMTKPWETRCKNPLWRRYFHYRQKTPFRLATVALYRFYAARFLRKLFDVERVYNDRRQGRWQVRFLFVFQFNLGAST